MDGDMFTENIVITDGYISNLFRLSNMLRVTSNDGVFPKFIVTSRFDASFDHCTRFDSAIISNFNAGLNHCKRMNRHPYTQTGIRTDGRQRMNAHKMPFNTSAKFRQSGKAFNVENAFITGGLIGVFVGPIQCQF
jgi:hypothetical protein